MKSVISLALLFAGIPCHAQTPTCGTIPGITSPSNAVSARTYGAIPGDGIDDTAALQRALDAGGAVLLEPGVYTTTNYIFQRTAGTRLYGPGATIHATNPDAMAILIQADNTGVFGLHFTAVTIKRKSAPWHARIAVYKEVASVVQTVRDVSIVGNVIAPVDGSSDGNSSSAAGIFLAHAIGFTVAGNTVVRTLSDGIHMTAGSRDGRVIGNTVRETGDDTIAVVSYASSGLAALNTAAGLRAQYDALAEQRLVKNILIADNDVSGAYWGRGIAVVGGADVTIATNRIDNIPLGAGIMIGRPAEWQTFGVRNVLITGNVQTRNQTDRSPYDPDGTFATKARYGHGAWEVFASLFEDEAADLYLRPLLAVSDVAFIGNTIRTAVIPAVRAGVERFGSLSAPRPDGSVATRTFVTGDVVNLSIGPATGVTRTGVTGSSMQCQ